MNTFWRSGLIGAASLLFASCSGGGSRVGLPPAHGGFSSHARAVRSIGDIVRYSCCSPNANLFGITVGADGALWYAENNGPTSGKIGRMTTLGSATEYQIPVPTPPGNLYVHPEGVTLGPDGNVWFSATNGYVGYITTSGFIQLYQIDTQPNVAAEFTSIVTGPDGNLWATENRTDNDRVWRINTVGGGTVMATLLHSARPNSIIAGPDSALWFTETNVNRIGRVATSGGLLEYAGPSGSNPQQIVKGNSGDLWFSDQGVYPSTSSTLVNMTTSGTIKATYNTAAPFVRPLAVGPNSTLWYSDSRIGSMLMSGPPPSSYGNFDPGTAIGGIVSGPDGAMWYTDVRNNTIDRVVTTPVPPPGSFTYTLGSATYPSGFNPTCGSSLIAWTPNGTQAAWNPANLSWVGGEEGHVSIGPCHAQAGDSITVSWSPVYGGVHLTRITSGDFYVQDNGDDSEVNITITDNTTGYAEATQIWVSY
jgi:streptogramin lyase